MMHAHSDGETCVTSGRVASKRRIAMRILVTGGAGFIGSNLARALLERGHQVRLLDNFSTGHRRNIEDLDVELVEGDLRSFERVATACRGVDVVFHQGALPSVPRSIQDPLTSNAVNVEGTLNVVLAARDHNVRRMIFASSSSIYGKAPGTLRRESQAVEPLAPYAVAKLAAERYALVADEVYGIETVALRYFNVFGDRQDPLSGYAAVIPKFIQLMRRGQRPPIFGDGTNSRDFTYIDNVVEANLLALDAADARGKAINIATQSPHSLNELVQALNRMLGTALEPRYLPPRPGDIAHSLADISLARDILGYAPTVDFDTGLDRTIIWFADQRADRTRSYA
jgi:UDP-glucose 4-epimerase